MKKRLMTMASVFTLATAAMLQPMPAMAAGTNYGTVIGGTKTTTFDKYLVMDKQANVPNAEFSFEVSAGAAKTYDLNGKTIEILAGVDADKVTVQGTEKDKIVYEPGDATVQDDNALVKNYDKGINQKYAKKTATLDFSACRFTEPGVYRYIITETGTNQGVTNDEKTTRIVDVYVTDATDNSGKKLNIAGYVLHADADDIAAGTDNGSEGTDPNGKGQGFTNSYDTSDLTIRKGVTGNQASKDKYFEFTVKITGAKAGTKYDVDITNADATSGSNAATINANSGKANVTELIADANGNVEQKFYLQDGQEIKIQGIAKDTKYEVTENPEDYKSTGAGVTDYTDATTGMVVSTDLKTSYLNTKDGVIPTGVVMAVAPFAAITILGGAGIVRLSMRKKKDDEEE